MFVGEDVETIVKGGIESAFGSDKQYNAQTVEGDANACIHNILRDLEQLKKPFKYIITCTILQKNGGAGLHTAAACFWDNGNDGEDERRVRRVGRRA